MNLPLKDRKELLEERLLTMVLISKEECLAAIDEESLELFSPKVSSLISHLKENGSDLPEDLKGFFDYLSLKAEVESELLKEEVKDDFESCLRSIKVLEMRSKLNEISNSLKIAEDEKNLEKISELTKAATDLTQKINSIKN